MKSKEDQLNEVTGITTLDTVPLEVFETATQGWQRVCLENGGKLGTVILANQYEIPKADILALAAEIENLGDEVSSVRAYVGIEEYSGDPTLSEMRLFFTGVDTANLPILQKADGKSAIYDFTMPCPPTC